MTLVLSLIFVYTRLSPDLNLITNMLFQTHLMWMIRAHGNLCVEGLGPLMRLSTVVSCLATLTHSLLVNNVIYNVIVICIVMLFMGSP